MKKKSKPALVKQIRIVIADDHPVVREGLGALVSSQQDMKIVSEAANGRQAVQQFLLHRPDVLLLDLRMPEMNGMETIHAILAKAPKAKIIVLSTYDGDEDVYRAL
jgi:two-component system NarL family response regulator